MIDDYARYFNAYRHLIRRPYTALDVISALSRRKHGFESRRARHLRQSTLQQPSSAIRAPCSDVALCENSVMCGPRMEQYFEKCSGTRCEQYEGCAPGGEVPYWPRTWRPRGALDESGDDCWRAG